MHNRVGEKPFPYSRAGGGGGGGAGRPPGGEKKKGVSREFFV